MQTDVYICYIDYVKAFDKVQHIHLFRILEGLDINGNDLELTKKSVLGARCKNKNWESCKSEPFLTNFYWGGANDEKGSNIR